MKITKAQKYALEVIRGMIDRSNTNVPDYGTKILALIFGILDVDYTYDDQITDLEGDKVLPINPNNGNDKIQIDVPDWIRKMPTPPFVPGDVTYPNQPPFPPQVWYNQEPEPIQTNKQEDRKYVTEVTYTGDKNGIVYTSNTADVRYNGDFRDEQTSLKDK
jgi:hypothetical protein